MQPYSASRFCFFGPMAAGLYVGMATMQPAAATSSLSFRQSGIASFYKAGGMTMAHRTLPKGTMVKVTDRTKHTVGKTICVRVADRGPYAKGRIADLSIPARDAIGLTAERGLMPVSIRVVAACP